MVVGLLLHETLLLVLSIVAPHAVSIVTPHAVVWVNIIQFNADYFNDKNLSLSYDAINHIGLIIINAPPIQ